MVRVKAGDREETGEREECGSACQYVIISAYSSTNIHCNVINIYKETV